MNSNDIKRAINDNAMTRFQVYAIMVCVLISIIDGYDVLSVAFVAPTLSQQWMIEPQNLGLLFSAGLTGMVMGALLLSPFADKLGRRTLVLCCLIILTIGMFASAISHNLTMLVASRVFTGFGMGAVLPALNTLVAEYSSQRSRSVSISAMTTGYTVGAMLGGLVSLFFMTHLSWRYVFYFGSLLSCITLPIAYCLLPESLDFIFFKKRSYKLSALNHVLKKLNLPLCNTLPDIKSEHDANMLTLFLTPSIFITVIRLCLGALLLMCSFYFLVNWMPKLLTLLGYRNDISITSSLIMNACGIFGGVVFGLLAKKYAASFMTSILLIVAFITVITFGFSQNSLYWLLFLIGMIGFLIYGAMAGVYIITANAFPPQIRVTATGIIFGVARLGAAIGPYLAGIFIAAGLPRSSYCFLLALPLLVAAVFVVKLNVVRQ